MSNHQHFICTTCGMQFSASTEAPAACPVCEDERQFVGHDGQEWTTLDTLRTGEYKNIFKEEEPGLFSIHTEPKVGIGQNAHLIQSPAGNILWDCITYLDDETEAHIRDLGGLSAIAISHPHFYSTMVEWARVFDVPVYLHAADREWVQRTDDHLKFWDGETLVINDDFTLIHCEGHFAGSQVLHWASGAAGQGALLTGDTIHVTVDRRYVTFMYSYPNLIPLSAPAIQHITQAIAPFAYDRIYGAFNNVLAENAQAGVAYSAERYMASITS